MIALDPILQRGRARRARAALAGLAGLAGGALGIMPALASPPLAAEVFAPGVISGPDDDFAPAFAPRSRFLLFTRKAGDRFTVLLSRPRGRSWSAPIAAPFSGRWRDLEAAISPDGAYVIFASDRPTMLGGASLQSTYAGKAVSGGNLWRSNFRQMRWSLPIRLPGSINNRTSVWTPSIAASGALYFMSTDPSTGRFRLHVAPAPQQNAPSVNDLAFSSGRSNDVDPAVDPRERFLLFSSDRTAPRAGDQPGPERLFIAFHPRGGSFVCPLAIAGWEDRALSQVEARLSPDGRTLYFASHRLAHGPGEPPRGAWDNGKSNIWQVPFTDRLWRASATDAACRSQGLSERAR